MYATRSTPVRPDTDAATAILGVEGTLIATSGNWEHITAIDSRLGLAESVWGCDLADLCDALRRPERHLSVAIRVGRLVRTALVHLQGVHRGGVWFVVARCVLPGVSGDDTSVSLIEAPVAAGDLVLVLDGDARAVLYGNRAAQAVGAHQGDGWADWVAAPDRARVRETLGRWRAADSTVPLWESFRVMRRDGETRWFVAVVAEVPGDHRAICCLAMDVTDERRVAARRPTARRWDRARRMFAV